VVFDAKNIESTEEEIDLLLVLESWRMSDFWRKWWFTVMSLPLFFMILLTTKDLIKIRREVLKGYRYPNNISKFTHEGVKYLAEQETS